MSDRLCKSNPGEEEPGAAKCLPINKDHTVDVLDSNKLKQYIYIYVLLSTHNMDLVSKRGTFDR